MLHRINVIRLVSSLGKTLVRYIHGASGKHDKSHYASNIHIHLIFVTAIQLK
jgi:hypothetical protein